ncbi:MAG: glutathione ABC transporter permease GsiD, partial [Nitrospinota bacterium]|nr:glutathione ABC transporter permease GsiD [Nitrospinota bacterium]
MSQSIAAPAPFVEDDPQVSPWKLSWNLLRKHKVALAGGIFVVLFIIVALSAPVIAPYNPILTDFQQTLKAPSMAHLFGTDHFGRDVMSRIIYGARTSLLIGVFSVLIAAFGGILLGLLGGYFTGWTDTIIMRGMDIMLSFPRILLSILLIAIIGTGMGNIMLAVGLFAIPTYARL